MTSCWPRSLTISGSTHAEHLCCMRGCLRGSEVERCGKCARVLGTLWERKKETPMDVTHKSVCHGCLHCRARNAVTRATIIFGRTGGGASTFTDNVVAFFNCVNDESVTATCKQVGLAENVARRLHDRARAIMASGAVRRQRQVVFPTLVQHKDSGH